MLMVPLSIVISWSFIFSRTVVDSVVEGLLCHNWGWGWDVLISVLDATRGGSVTAALLLPLCEYMVCCGGTWRVIPPFASTRWWPISLTVSAVLISYSERPCPPRGIVEEMFVLASSNFVANINGGPEPQFGPPDWSSKVSTVLWLLFCLKMMKELFQGFYRLRTFASSHTIISCVDCWLVKITQLYRSRMLEILIV